MTPRHWTGDDDRDTLTAGDEADDCQHCPARWNEACVEDCDCPHCLARRPQTEPDEAA